MSTQTILFFLLLVPILNSTVNVDRKMAVLVYPLGKVGESVGEPGQLVYITFSDTIRQKVTLEINDKFYPNIDDNCIIPYDTMFTASRAYLYLLNHERNLWSQDILIEAKNAFLFAKNICALFPRHPLYEDIYALLCKNVEEYESIESYGKTNYPESISILNKYLLDFPNGKYKDQIEWQLVTLKNDLYEYEGSETGPLNQIEAYETYLNNHIRSTYSDAIKLEIARLYRIASECVEHKYYDRKHDNINIDYAIKLSSKAVAIYKLLVSSPDVKIRESAKVALFNITHNRKTYIGNNDW
ncbi:MAG: hypothetical protein EHM64_12785 [Ignavibacteriae bacterium]|nr:MAG: hypothetical protein EHM64_12785 [Ignavibacteriota bacterium]